MSAHKKQAIKRKNRKHALSRHSNGRVDSIPAPAGRDDAHEALGV